MASPSSSSSSSRSRRQVEDATAVGLDPLVWLPPDMLNNILARLPFEQLVLTSCLSRGWRRRWESIADLDIWFSPGVSPKPSIRALKRCAAPVRSFTARVLPSHFASADGWLRALRGKRVAKLAVELFDPRARFLGDVDGACLPSIFLHRELVHLDLAGCCYIPPIPQQGFGGFPNLVTLSLNHVRLPFFGGGAHLQYIISSAPNLAELSLIDVDQEERGFQVVRCDIRAPKLRVLKLVMLNDNDNGCEIAEHLPMLEEAVISADCLLETDEFVTTFQRIATVKKLTFRTDSRKCSEDPLRVISWKFQNLKVATLSANFGKLSSIMSIFSLLRCAPHIEKLEIEVEKTKIQDDEDDENFDPETYDDDDDFLSDLDMVENKIDEHLLHEKASDDLFVSLKHVSLHGIKCYMPNEICFMKFLLSKTGSLESFDVTLRSEFRKEIACAVLSTCSRASPQAKISVRLLNKPTPEPDES